MAGVGAAGVSLAEVYAMRALYKEKMKKLKKQEAAGPQSSTTGAAADDENKIPSGCFFWVSTKNQSAKVSSAAESDRKLQVDKNWNCKS